VHNVAANEVFQHQGAKVAVSLVWLRGALLVVSACLPVLQLSIKEGEISTGLGKQTKEFDIERKIKIVYLDDNLRIAR
jgi:hypothetical protein